MKRVSAIVATTAIILAALIPLSAAATSSPKPGTAAQVKALVGASVKITKLSKTVAAQLLTAAGDNASSVYGIPTNCPSATSCVYGDKTGTQSIVLYGDSHARMWLPSIVPIATTKHLKLILIGQDGCPAASITLTGAVFAGCNAARPGYVTTINAIKPVGIIISNRTSYSGYSSTAWQEGMTATITSLAPSKAKIAIIGDNQELKVQMPACLAAYPTSVQKCITPNPNTKAPTQVKAEKAAAKATKALYVDPTLWLCTPTKCAPVIGNFIAYWNSLHVSVTYARYLSTVAATALKSVL